MLYVVLGEWRILRKLFLKSFRLLIFDWLCIKQYHMSLPYDLILSLSDVTKFCSLRNVYVLNPSPSTLVTKIFLSTKMCKFHLKH